MNRVHIACLMLLVLPSAQALTLDVEGPQAPLQPDTAYPLTLHVAVSCTAVLAHPDLEPRLAVAVEAEGITVTGPQSTTIDRQECAAKEELTVVFEYMATATRDTIAEEPIPIWFAAALGDEDQEEAQFPVEVAYVGTFSATVVSDHQQAAPQKDIPFELVIQNRANARTVFTFHAVEPPKDGHLVLPDEVILEPDGRGQSEIVVTVLYVTPFENGPNEAREELFVEVRSESTKGTAGDNTTIHLTADTEGFYVPAGAWLPALALGGALLARRRL